MRLLKHGVKKVATGFKWLVAALPIVVKQNSPSVGLFTHARDRELSVSNTYKIGQSGTVYSECFRERTGLLRICESS